MAAIILPRKWTRQPSGPVEVNDALPFPPLQAWHGANPTVVIGSYLPDTPLRVFGTPLIQPYGEGGVGHYSDASHGLYWPEPSSASDPPKNFPELQAVTLLAVALGTGGNFQTAFSRGRKRYGIGPYSGSQNGWWVGANEVGYAPDTFWSGSNFTSTNILQCGVCSIDGSAGTMDICVAGKTGTFAGSSTFTGPLVYDYGGRPEADRTLAIGGSPSFSSGGAWIYAVAWWPRVLPSGYLRELAQAPWQIFRPIRRRLYFPSAAAGGATIDVTRVDLQLQPVAFKTNESVLAARADVQLQPVAFKIKESVTATRVDLRLTTVAFKVNESVVSGRTDLQLVPLATKINESVVAARASLQLQPIAATLRETVNATRATVELQTLAVTLVGAVTIDAGRVDLQFSPYAPKINESVIASRADLQLVPLAAKVNESVIFGRAVIQLAPLSAKVNESVIFARADIELATNAASITYGAATTIDAARADIRLLGASPAAFINESIAAGRCDIELRGLLADIQVSSQTRGHVPGYPKRHRGGLRPDWSSVWEEERRRIAKAEGRTQAGRTFGELLPVEARIAAAREMLSSAKASAMVELGADGSPTRMMIADARRHLELNQAELERLISDDEEALAVILISASL